MKKLLLLAFAFVIFNPLFAQKQTYNWNFGNNAGVNFSTGVPVYFSGSALVTLEGCASISDSLGNLLFYSDGSYVWNKNNVVMPNGSGLLGNSSSTQSGVCVPFPGNPDKYYLFAVDDVAGPNGLTYSVVDMTLQGGLGDIVAGQKNIPLISPTSEKVTAVMHCNGHDIWVVTRGWNNNKFYAYLINNTGINTTPVVTSIGSVISGSINNTIGYMKFSPDGKKVAYAVDHDMKIMELFDFDKATGTFSNAMTFNGYTGYNGGWGGGPYGVEFSPDSHLLYVGEEGDLNMHLWQYDVTLGTQAAINASKTVVGTSNGIAFGALQQAVDGKIYVCIYGSTYLAVINNPNTNGLGCNFVANGASLGVNTCQFGLPSFIQSYFQDLNFTLTTNNPNIPADSSYGCIGDSLIFNASVTGFDSISWNFGDPGSGVLDTSTSWIVGHHFSQVGTYNVMLIAYHQCGAPDTVMHQVNIYPLPTVDLGNDTAKCPNQVLTLSSITNGATYLWSDNSTSPTLQVPDTGMYWVQVTTSHGCVSRDSVNVVAGQPPVVNLGNDTVICPDGSFVLTPITQGISYLWQDNSTAQSDIVTQPGMYWVQITMADGCSNRDTVQITTYPLPTVDIGSDTTICQGTSLTLTAVSNGVGYLWQDNSTSATDLTSQGGIYWVQATSTDGCAKSDSMNLTLSPLPSVVLPDDTVICNGTSALLSPLTFQDVTSFLWQDGSTQSNYTVTKPGVYILEVTNICGSYQDSITLTGSDCDGLYCHVEMPTAFSPNNDGLNDIFRPISDCGIESIQLQVFNRWGQLVFQGNDLNKGWDGTWKGFAMPMDTYVYSLTYTGIVGYAPVKQSLKGSVILVR